MNCIWLNMSVTRVKLLTMTNLWKAVVGLGIALIVFGAVSLLREGTSIAGVTGILLGAALVLMRTSYNAGSVRQRVSRGVVIVLGGAVVVLAILALVHVFPQT
jgi:hypothetical protein